MEKPTTEIEHRYKIDDPQTCIASLGALGISLVSSRHLIDEWFAPAYIRNLKQEEDWFDNQKGVAWRIRRSEQPDGTFAVQVGSKQLTDASNHNTFIEQVMPHVSDYHDARAKMADMNYRNWLTIDKTRFTFDSGRADIELVLDSVAGLAEAIGVGAVLEIEYKGTVNREQALSLLGEFAAQLGFRPGDRFDRSLTVEAKPALANFDD